MAGILQTFGISEHLALNKRFCSGLFTLKKKNSNGRKKWQEIFDF